MRQTAKMTLTATALAAGLLGGTFLAFGAQTNLASMAKIDATKATSAALARVPGKVLKVALDNQKGNLVYSVVIKTASNGIKYVKVDADSAAILNIGVGGEDNGIEKESGGDSDQEDK